MTVRFLADENVNRRIIVGLQRRTRSIDVVRVQDIGLRTADDPEVLQTGPSGGPRCGLVRAAVQLLPDHAADQVDRLLVS